MNTTSTRQKLLDVGVRLMLDRGYHNTGLQDILTEAAVPRGSFYHHFGSKEAFGTQVIAHYSDQTYRALDEQLSDAASPPMFRLKRFFDIVFADWTKDGCRRGCLMGNLGQEVSDTNEHFRQQIATALDRWAERITQCIMEAQSAGQLTRAYNPREVADRLIDGFQGAALRMKLTKDPAPLNGFIACFFDHWLIRKD